MMSLTTSWLEFGSFAAKFRSEHSCSDTKGGTEQANVYPYFIGAFDTVAALGNKWLAPILILLSLPCGPSSCRTGARPSRDAGAWLVGLHQGAAAQLRADAHAPIAESAALALSCTAI